MQRRGVTLLEIVVVLVILATLAALVVPLVDGTVKQSREAATHASMTELRAVLVGRYWTDMNDVLPGTDGYPRPNPNALNGRPPQAQPNPQPQLHFLFIAPGGLDPYNSVARRGWNGPYLQHSGARYAASDLYGEPGDATVLDGWGHPIVLQVPAVGTSDVPDPKRHARLVSAGPDGVISTPADVPRPPKSDCGDDLVLFLRTPDVRP